MKHFSCTSATVTSVIAIVLAALTLSSCKISIKKKSEFENCERVVKVQKAFKAIEISGWPEVIFTQDSVYSIKIVGNENHIDDIDVYSSTDSTLIVSRKWRDSNNKITLFSDNNAVKCYVSAPSLEAVSILNSGDFKCNGLKSDTIRFELRESGSVDVTLNDCGYVEINNLERNLVRLKGSVKDLVIENEDSFHVEIQDLKISGKKIIRNANN